METLDGPFLQVACWVLGEYGALAPGGAAAARDRLVATGEAAALSDPIRGYLLSALAKLAAQSGLPLGAGGEELVSAAASSHSADLQQRALEMRALLGYAPCNETEHPPSNSPRLLYIPMPVM